MGKDLAFKLNGKGEKLEKFTLPSPHARGFGQSMSDYFRQLDKQGKSRCNCAARQGV